MPANLRASAALAALAAAVLTLPGCARKPSAPAPATLTWSNAAYRLTASYPADWKVKDLNTIDDPRTKAVGIVLFNRPDERGTGEVRETSPFVKIVWVPASQPQTSEGTQESGVTVTQPNMPSPVPGIKVQDSGITSGWKEFGAEEVETRQVTVAGVQAVEGTALAKAGTAFLATYTGQLVGASQRVRVVEVPAAGGRYQITRVGADGTDEPAIGDQIIASLRFTR